MKNRIYALTGLILLILMSKGNTQSLSKSWINKDKIGIYLLYNLQQNINNADWTSGNYSGKGESHDISMMGFGLKYYLNDYLFIDYSQKTMTSIKKIGTMSTPTYLCKSSLEDLDTYSIAINYYYYFKTKFDFIFGVGLVLNKAQFRPYDREINYVPSEKVIFTSNLIRTGIEYRIKSRYSISIIIGFESRKNIEETYGVRRFEYKYESPYYLEPTITFYF